MKRLRWILLTLMFPHCMWAAISRVQTSANQFATNFGSGNPPNLSVSYTLGSVGTPINQHDLVIIDIGQGCDREQVFQDCPAPIVTLTINGTNSILDEIDGFDPSHLVARFYFYTCDAAATGIGTISITTTAHGSNPNNIPQIELGTIATQYTGNEHASSFSCLDLPDISNPSFFNQCQTTSGNASSSLQTTLLPGGSTRGFFISTTNLLIHSFQYDRMSNHTWTISGNPNSPDFTQQGGAASFLNPTSTGQSMMVAESVIANATSPPYDWTFTIGSGGFSTSIYMDNCIAAFDSGGTIPHLSSAKKKGLLF